MRRIFTIAVLLTAGWSAWGQTAPIAPWSASYRAQQVAELRREGRLPGWANYICGEDQIGLHGGILMLIAYQQSGFSVEAGYIRGLTYQEYFGTDEKNASPTTINMPMSPEEIEQNKIKVANALSSGKGGNVSVAFLERTNAEMIAADNQIALMKRALSRGFISDADMKDEMIQAMLDGPYGTNWRAFVAKHPDVWEMWFAHQKYENTGNAPPDDVKVYREGNVIFETGYTGSGTFETTAGMDKSSDFSHSLNVRIQMTPTPSGLRYTQSYPSGLGMTINGACDPIVQDK